MKGKKRLWAVVIALLTAALLAGCGTASTEPSTEELETSVAEDLNVYYPVLNMTDCQVEQSLTEDKTYTATLSVSGETMSGYAEWWTTAYVTFTKYDQGWSMDSCEWSELEYDLRDMTEEEQQEYVDSVMDSLLADRMEHVDIDDATYAWLNSPEYELYDMGMTDEGDETDGTFAAMALVADADAVLNDYIGVKGDFLSYWIYDIETDTWDFYKDNVEEVYPYLLVNIEGEYLGADSDDNNAAYVKLSNQTESDRGVMYNWKGEEMAIDAITVEMDKYNTGSVTMELTTGSMLYEDDQYESKSTVSYWGTNDEGAECRLEISVKEYGPGSIGQWGSEQWGEEYLSIVYWGAEASYFVNILLDS